MERKSYFKSFPNIRTHLLRYCGRGRFHGTERLRSCPPALGVTPSDRLKTMSKGTKEKVQLVLVMARKAQLYLLDEPIAGVDPAARDFILNTILTNYNEEGTVMHRALGGLEQAAENLNQGCFAAAVGAKQAYDAAPAQLQAHAGQGGFPSRSS